MIKGIDIYTGNGYINFKQVKSSGVDFVMIKATQGHGVGATTRNLFCFTDSKFKTNVENAYKAGLQIGVYHYFTARDENEADTEAAHFIKTINPYKKYITLWAAIDVEDETYCNPLSKDVLTKLTRRFMTAVKNAGYKPILYTNPNYLQYKFIRNAFKTDDIWLAHWGVKQPMAVDNMQMWQYGAGRVNGCSTAVDLNYGYWDTVAAIKETVSTNKRYKIKAGAVYKQIGSKPAVKVPFSIRQREFSIIKIMTFNGEEYALLSGISSWVALKYLEEVK